MSNFSVAFAAFKSKARELWEAFKMDFNERFMNFDTIRGLIKVPVGLTLAYMALYHIQFFFQTCGACAGLYFSIDGLRNIFSNEIKKELAKIDKINRRICANACISGSPAK